MTNINFKEEFLHFIWRFSRFDLHNLKTSNDEVVSVVHPGWLNTGAGPDFHDARLRIGGTLWAGNVEIHIRSSDWYRHGHGLDKAYDNIILHVVYEADVDVYRSNGYTIPCLQLKERIDPGLVSMYQVLHSGKTGIPCKNLIEGVSTVIFASWLDRLMVERLEAKAKKVIPILQYHKNDWEAVFYEWLAAGFGLKVNTGPFGLLARSLPLKLVRRHLGQPVQIEALFFGQAGFLEEDFEEQYPIQLKKEFAFLRKKYGLKPLKKLSWKFLRMRPSGFPTLRIANFAALIANRRKFFSDLELADTPADFIQWLNVPVNPYWESHYRFGKKAKGKPGKIGKGMVTVLLVNVVIPFLFLYGQQRSNEKMKNKALRWFEMLKPEDNKIIRMWKSMGITPENAARSQALIHLKRMYCDSKRCLDCAVGSALLKPPR